MTSISNIPNQFPEFQPISSSSPFAGKTQEFQALAQTSTTSNFSFTTAEGDRVSLATGSESLFSFESYNFQGFAEGGAVDIRTQYVSTANLSDFSLLVEGDLNKEELADIQAFLQSAKDILKDLAGGKVEKAAEAALSLRELDSLSTAALFYRQETRVSLEARSTQLAFQGNKPPHKPGRQKFNTDQGHTIERVFDDIRKTQERFQIHPDTLATRLPTILNTLLQTLKKPFSPGESSETIFDQIRKELLESVLQTTHNPPTKEETQGEVHVEDNQSNVDNSTSLRTKESDGILQNLS